METGLKEKIDALGPWAQRIKFHTKTENLATPGKWYPEKYYELLSPFMDKDLKGKLVIDCGCNAGGVGMEFAKRGAKVIGLDKGQRCIDQANLYKDTCYPDLDINFFCDSVFNLHKYPKADYVLCLGLIYHFRYYQLLLDYLSFIEMGKLFISTQIYNNKHGGGESSNNRKSNAKPYLQKN